MNVYIYMHPLIIYLFIRYTHTGRAVAKTRVKRRTLAPEWGEIFIFETPTIVAGGWEGPIVPALPKFATLEVRVPFFGLCSVDFKCIRMDESRTIQRIYPVLHMHTNTQIFDQESLGRDRFLGRVVLPLHPLYQRPNTCVPTPTHHQHALHIQFTSPSSSSSKYNTTVHSIHTPHIHI